MVLTPGCEYVVIMWKRLKHPGWLRVIMSAMVGVLAAGAQLGAQLQFVSMFVVAWFAM